MTTNSWPDSLFLNMDIRLKVAKLRWPSSVRREPGIIVDDASELVALWRLGSSNLPLSASDDILPKYIIAHFLSKSRGFWRRGR